MSSSAIDLHSLNPLFIRSQFQSEKVDLLAKARQYTSQSLIHQVSISEIMIMTTTALLKTKSQSLIHQVSISEIMIMTTTALLKTKSQSLIHQVSISEKINVVVCRDWGAKSQSLIHQVSISEGGLFPANKYR